MTTACETIRNPKRQRRRRIAMPPIEKIEALALALFKGGLTPKNVNRPEHLTVRIVAGWEVGLSPVQSVNFIMVVNGRISIWGDAALGLVRNSGLLAFHDEFVEGDDEARVGICKVQRDGEARREFRFSVGDAKTAGLWEKEGPWQTYPNRMLTVRARAWALRDVFTDVLCGLGIAEEELDIPVKGKEKEEPKPEQSAPPVADQTQPANTATEADQPKTSEPITEETLKQIASERPSWLRSIGVDPDDESATKAAWLNALQSFGVTTAKSLTAEQGGQLLAMIRKEGHEQEKKEVFEEAAAT